MNKNIKNDLLQYIRNDNCSSFIDYCENYIECDLEYKNYEYFFKIGIINACLYNRIDIVKYLLEKYNLLDDVSKIAIRQIFPYCRHLCKSKNHTELLELFEKSSTKTNRNF